MEDHSTRRSDAVAIIKGAGVNLLGTVMRSLNFVFYIVLARLYGAESTGLYLIAWNTVDISSKLSIIGLDKSMLKFVAERKAVEDESGMYTKVANALQLGFFFALGIIVVLELLTPVITSHLLSKPHLLPMLRLMIPGILFWTMTYILLFSTRGLRIMRYEIYARSLAEPITLVLFSIPFYLLGFDETGLGIAFLFSTAAGAVTSLYLFSRAFDIKKLKAAFADTAGRRALLLFSYPIGLTDMTNLLMQRIDIFLLSRYASAGAVGVYGISQEVVSLVKKIRMAFDPIFMPVVAGARELGNHGDVLSHFRSVTRWILMIYLPILGVYAIAGKDILALFGSSFGTDDAVVVLVLLSLAVGFNNVLGVSELFLVITRPMINMVNLLCAMALAFLLGLWLVPAWGAPGAAMTMAIAYLVLNIVRLVEVGVLFRMHPFTLAQLKSVLSFLVAAALAWLLRLALHDVMPIGRGVPAAALFIGLYLGVLILLGLNSEERMFLNRLVKRAQARIGGGFNGRAQQ